MKPNLTGRVALITGGSKGIGRAIALSLCEEGASVAITARNLTDLEKSARMMVDSGFDVLAIPADATDQCAVDSAIQRIIDCYGRLDILVNNVGGVSKFGGFADLHDDDWRNAFEVNVMSMVHFVRASEAYLRDSPYGRIINISSISAVQPGTFNPHYTITKAATLNLSKFLANYFVKDGVLVNTICPGPVHSASWDSNVNRLSLERNLSYETVWEQVEKEESIKVPIGRIGEGEDISGLVAFLASDKASWITGSCFHINGGKLASVL